MVQPTNPATDPPKTLADLTAEYLGRQAAAHADGVGFAEPAGDVVPFDAVPAQPVEPRLAWGEACQALRHFAPGGAAAAVKAPADWAGLVANREPLTALPFCLGNYPQLVRDLHPLWRGGSLRALLTPVRPLAAPGVVDWASRALAEGRSAQALLGAGVARLAGDLEAAGRLLDDCRANLPPAWQAAAANEEAALAWHRGDAEAALAAWGAQAESVPVLFNRGVAALFLDRPGEARPPLARAAQQLAEDDAWHHLARLYLALAEMRG
jgi:hypothetical protein